jgi:ribosome-associated protein
VIHIKENLHIPENELSFTASRSGGPGGQNVNKVSSRVTLSFDVAQSSALSEDQKRTVMNKLATRMSKDGVLRVVSQRTRSQDMNRTDAIERFSELLRTALTPKATRVKTRVPVAANRQRLERKRKRTLTKQGRSRKGWDL